MNNLLCISSAIFGIFCATISARAENVPEKLANLKIQYDLSVERAVAPLTAKYLESLRALKLEYTKSGSLEDAMATENAIKALAKQDSADRSVPQLNPTPPFVGRWAAPNGPIDILPDRKARHGTDFATWEVRDNELILSWDNGYKHRYPSSFSGDTMRGRNFPPRGNSNPIVLTRIRQ